MARGKNMDRPKVTIKRSVDSFIEGAKEKTAEPSSREKTFLLRLPHDLWKEAKMRALEEGVTLHEFILSAIREKLGGY